MFMDYEKDIPSDEYELELSQSWYQESDWDDEPEEYFDYAEYNQEEFDHQLEEKSFYRRPRWTPLQVVFILIAIVIIAALLVFVFLPWLQVTIAPTPTYMPPPSTPLSQL